MKPRKKEKIEHGEKKETKEDKESKRSKKDTEKPKKDTEKPKKEVKKEDKNTNESIENSKIERKSVDSATLPENVEALVEELKREFEKISDASKQKRFPTPLVPLFYKVCMTTRIEIGGWPQSLTDRFSSFLPYSASTLKTKFNKLKEIQPQITQFKEKIQNNLETLKKLIEDRKTSYKPNSDQVFIDSELENQIYALVQLEENLLKSANELRKLEGQNEFAVENDMADFYKKMSTQFPESENLDPAKLKQVYMNTKKAKQASAKAKSADSKSTSSDHSPKKEQTAPMTITIKDQTNAIKASQALKTEESKEEKLEDKKAEAKAISDRRKKKTPIVLEQPPFRPPGMMPPMMMPPGTMASPFFSHPFLPVPMPIRRPPTPDELARMTSSMTKKK
eukprot:TRINITY_DN8196_c0_g1_i2.p1 TRINITY_DN8196_c0_g1~~TRINITY_DN8196_c0_g1_i2.p1  ORF type:complete len:407 (+),score=116.52 TRINITY_DN8196_c0_g1_i2:42-1223(+)